MEIITYFEAKHSLGTTGATLTVEDMLRLQPPSQSHSRAVRREKEAHAANVLSVIDRFCGFLVRARVGVLVICALLCLASAATWVREYVYSFAIPVSFQTESSPDSLILSGQMRNFALGSDAIQADSEGNLSLIDATEAATLFSRPVSFSPYTVQSGDSISTISQRFGLTNISTLIGVNDIDNVRLLRAGQELSIPSVDGLMYSVKAGDSLDLIAQRHGISVEEILDVNELASSVILPNDKLFIPGARLDSTSLKKALGELFSAPLSTAWRISSPYGYRADPFTGVRTLHTGIDLVVPQGTSVKAAMSGTVAYTGYSNVYGYHVLINHGNGYQTMYAHFKSAAPVKVGQTVGQGRVIGYVGNTGYSTGAHLHFSVYKNGKLINPTQVLKF